MRAQFTCAECGATSPAMLVSADELDTTPRHAEAVAKRLHRRPARRGEHVAPVVAVRVERHVCDGSGRPPAVVVTELGL